MASWECSINYTISLFIKYCTDVKVMIRRHLERFLVYNAKCKKFRDKHAHKP